MNGAPVFSRVRTGGYGYRENTFTVVQPDGREVVVVIDKETTARLADDFAFRAKRMVNPDGSE